MSPQFWQGVMAASAAWIGLSIATCAAFAWLLRTAPLEHEFECELDECETPRAPITPGAARSSRRKAA